MSFPIFGLCIPVYQPGVSWTAVLSAFKCQSVRAAKALIVSSNASENDLNAAASHGFDICRISPESFDHGGTRQEALRKIAENCELIVFMTQDSILASSDALKNLLKTFYDPNVGAAWGRQLPHDTATAIAAHARHYNYPGQSRKVSSNDIQRLGIKAAFCSNSFAAYRISALKDIGGFPCPVVLGEDMCAAARLLQAGYRVAYVADAAVYHSHNYTPLQELSRYFDTGAFHADNPWLLERFGKPLDEGKRFVASEFRYLWKHSRLSLPHSIIATACKYLGYKLGTHFRALPADWPTQLGMNKTYWKHWNEKHVDPSNG